MKIGPGIITTCITLIALDGVLSPETYEYLEAAWFYEADEKVSDIHQFRKAVEKDEEYINESQSTDDPEDIADVKANIKACQEVIALMEENNITYIIST